MLTLQFVPYNELEDLSEDDKINKLLGIVRENKIVLLEGRLKQEEEASLISRTMEEVDEGFKGIELSVLNPEKQHDFFGALKHKLGVLLLGNRKGLTIIGPANIIKEIKKDPDKIQLFTNDKKKKKRSR